MSRRQKQLAKLAIPSSDINWTLDEIVQLMAWEGWSHKGGEGSHRVYSSPDSDALIVLAVHGKGIKPVYIKTIRNILIKGSNEDN